MTIQSTIDYSHKMKKTHQKNLQNFYKHIDTARSDIRNKNLYNLISSKVKGERILDIGSGAGNFLKVLKNKGFTVEGIEPDKNLINISRKNNKKISKTYNFKAEEAARVNKKFDTITMIDVLEHIENDILVLKNNRKILTANGRLVILVPAFQFLFSMRDREIGHYRRYGYKELKNKLIKAGYVIEELRFWNALGFFVYLLFEKIINQHASIASLRTGNGNGFFQKIAHRKLDWWMKNIENRTNFGFGLSLICVATKRA